MPGFKALTELDVIRRLRAFLGGAGGEDPASGAGAFDGARRSDPGSQEIEEVRQRLREARNRLARKDGKIAELRTRLAQKGIDGQRYGIEAENIVWIFGTGRSGSTWLASMLGELPANSVWNEPLVGAMLGNFYFEYAAHRAEKGGKYFILGRRYKEIWLEPVRALVLGGAAARFPERAEGGYVMIKEPHGSVGAPLLMEALPESRMILLVRDPRDVVASSIDAHKEGSWLYERRKEAGHPREALTGEDLDAFVEDRARAYLQSAGNARQAYETHAGLKALVRYEDLRADTVAEMRRICSELEIPVGEGELERAVEKFAWENIPEEEKGEGKIRRKARPGSWREDLTTEQARIVGEITAPLLEAFYPAGGLDRGPADGAV